MKGVAAFAALFLSLPAWAQPPAQTLDEWIAAETRISTERMLRNISPPGSAPGTVLASPSGSSPDYRYHWIRDASVVIDQIREPLSVLENFVSLSRREQLEPSAQGLGEPRFRVDGPADTLPWARPQFDGPALRALVLTRALPLLKESTRWEAIATLRVDLDFVARYWRTPCFDLWEELRGLHFYTQSVQYAALLAGAEVFAAQGESALANHFRGQARSLKQALQSYWDSTRGYIGATRELEIRPNEPDYKDENLDTAVILAALHARVDRGILAYADDRLLATASALESAFRSAYAINQMRPEGQAVAIGRFTDDVYFGGNPWYVTTAAFAELHYRVARALEKNGSVTVTPRNRKFLGTELAVGTRVKASSRMGLALVGRLRRKGDDFMAILRRYSGSQGELSEQFDRDAGVPASAFDLSWSYAAFLSAAHARTGGD